MSYNNIQAKPEDEDLYDILDLLPPTITKNSGLLDQQFGDFASPNDPAIAPSPQFPVTYAQEYNRSFPVNRHHLGMTKNTFVRLMPSNPENYADPTQDYTNGNSDYGKLTLNTNVAGPYNNNHTPSPATDLLSPVNFHQQQNHLNPSGTNSHHSSQHSQHSFYSDQASQPTSPFYDAASQFLAKPTYSDVGSQGLQLNQYLDTNQNVFNTFDTEIALGGSVSSTNLVSMELQQIQPPKMLEQQQVPRFNYSLNNQPMPSDYADSRLTENNLINYNNAIKTDDVSRDIVISIQHAPEEVAARTPSLFSNSSANSSIPNSPRGELSRQNTGGNSLVPNSQLVPASPGSMVSATSDAEGSLLRPEEFQSIRRGRKKSHHSRSRSISRSPSRVHTDGEEGEEDEEEEDEDDFSQDESEDEDGNVSVSTREKMLELASPAQSSKRTQKHPSVYACHLCEKRFTRPYNLKSHLRTHTDERPFICSVCGKAFARQHDRKRHEELHTGEKKFQCKGFLKDGTPYGCGRRFARADALRRHFQTENGKACIRVLIEEEEHNKDDPGSTSTNDYLSPTSAMFAHGSTLSIPQVAISPPD